MDITLDVSGWNMDKISMIEAMVYKLLHDAAITTTGVKYFVATSILTVDNPSSDPTSILTVVNISNAYDAWKVINDAATAAEIARLATLEAELGSNEFNARTLSEINTLIDNAYAAANTAGEVKTVTIAIIKKLARYIKARGI